MSVKIMGLVWDEPIDDPILKYVLVAMADHADHDGENVRPKLKTLAKKTGLGVRTIRNKMRELEWMGYAALERDAVGHRGRSWKLIIPPAKPTGRQELPPTEAPDASLGRQEPPPLMNRPKNHQEKPAGDLSGLPPIEVGAKSRMSKKEQANYSVPCPSCGAKVSLGADNCPETTCRRRFVWRGFSVLDNGVRSSTLPAPAADIKYLSDLTREISAMAGVAYPKPTLEDKRRGGVNQIEREIHRHESIEGTEWVRELARYLAARESGMGMLKHLYHCLVNNQDPRTSKSTGAGIIEPTRPEW